jgi:bifunctional DNase/RNase
MDLTRQSAAAMLTAAWLSMAAGCGDGDGKASVTGVPDGTEALTIQEVVFTQSGEPNALLIRPSGGLVFLPLTTCGSDLIYGRLHDTLPPRPVTYDLFDSISRGLRARVLQVLLQVTAGDSLTATVTVSGTSGSADLPATTTDAIGIAQATGATVFATREFLALPRLASSAKVLSPDPPGCCVPLLDGAPEVAKTAGAYRQLPEAGFVDMSVLGLIGNPFGSANVMLIDAGDTKVMTIIIGPCNAFALFAVLSELESTEPRIHPLLDSVITTAGGEVEHVRITDVRDNTYIGEIGISRNGVMALSDARPSDAMVLALLTDLSIQVAQPVLDVFGEDADDYRDLIDEIREFGE